MHKWFLVSLLSMTLIGPAQINRANSRTPQSDPEPEEYAVYAVLLKEFMGKETKQLVIMKHTAVDDISGHDPSQMLGRLSPLTKETAEDFKVKNARSYELSNKFNLQVEISFLTKDEVKELFGRRDDKRDGWSIFHQKYPTAGAIITLSRVGFSDDRTQALVFVAHGCGWLCGEGNYIVLTKKDGAWKVEKRSMLWIS